MYTVTLQNVVCPRCGYKLHKQIQVDERDLPLQEVCSRCNAMLEAVVDENGNTKTYARDF